MNFLTPFELKLASIRGLTFKSQIFRSGDQESIYKNSCFILKIDSYDITSPKTWAKDEKGLSEVFPVIYAELTASRSFSRNDNRTLYSCHGQDATFLYDSFQNAQKICKNGIRSFLNEAGIDYIQSTPDITHADQTWSGFYFGFLRFDSFKVVLITFKVFKLTYIM